MFPLTITSTNPYISRIVYRLVSCKQLSSLYHNWGRIVYSLQVLIGYGPCRSCVRPATHLSVLTFCAFCVATVKRLLYCYSNRISESAASHSNRFFLPVLSPFRRYHFTFQSLFLPVSLFYRRCSTFSYISKITSARMTRMTRMTSSSHSSNSRRSRILASVSSHSRCPY
jgi:hypothetical protein